MSGRYVDEVVKMKPTKGHHLTRYRMIIAKEDMVVANEAGGWVGRLAFGAAGEGVSDV
jgi:hypothetical protein